MNGTVALWRGGAGAVWDEETIAAYLADPRGYVRGNRMAFVGLKSEEEIANVIAYLAQFSEMSEEGEAAEEAEAAEGEAATE